MGRRARGTWAASLLVLSACGGKAHDTGAPAEAGVEAGEAAGGSGGIPDDAGPSGDGGCVIDGLPCDPDLLDDEDCVAAWRIDRCCRPWQAVTNALARAEPCLVAVGEPWPRGPELEACLPPPQCASVDCEDQLSPPSRIARRIDGACAFVDECVADGDCTLGEALTSCCPCTESLPKLLVEQELCLATLGEAVDINQCITTVDCLSVFCDDCEPKGVPRCGRRDGLNRCE